MRHTGTREIRTERILLRKLELSDAGALAENRLFGGSACDVHHILQGICACYINDHEYHWGIEYGGAIVGRIKCIEFSQRDDFVQLAYDTAEAFRGRGLMTEAVRGVIRFLFSKVGVHRIYAQVRVTNIASVRVLQKSGMVHEGRLRKHFKEAESSYVDVDVYAIIREDLAQMN